MRRMLLTTVVNIGIVVVEKPFQFRNFFLSSPSLTSHIKVCFVHVINKQTNLSLFLKVFTLNPSYKDIE